MDVYRCHVDDVDAALRFYRALGFRLLDRVGPRLAVLQRARLVVWLCTPAWSGTPTGPATTNRLVLEVKDLAQLQDRLRALGAQPVESAARAGADPVLLVLDPAGNPVELLQAETVIPASKEHP